MERRRDGTPSAGSHLGATTPECGFTLIELLVAATLFALILTGIYRTFHTGIGARRQAEAHLETQRSVNRALGIFGDDLRNMAVYQPVAFSGLPDSLGFAALLVDEENGPVAELHVIRYVAAADSGLVRIVRPLRHGAARQVQLLSVGWRCQFFYLAEREGEKVEWMSAWEAEWGMPVAVKLVLNLERGNRLFTRSVDLPFSRR